MSRLETQSERLVRGASQFERQKSFLVQPQRFATGQVTPISEIVGRLAGAAKGINEINAAARLAEDREEAENRERLKNTTFSRLTDLEDRLNNDPDFNPNDYMNELNSALEVFDEDTTEGLQLRQRFLSKPEYEQFLRDKEANQLEAIQGVYLSVADKLVIRYNTQDEIARLSRYEYPDAVNISYKEILSAYTPEQIDSMSLETKNSLFKKAEEAAEFSRSAHKEIVKQEDRFTNERALQSIKEKQFQADTYDLKPFQDHAKVAGRSFSSVLSELIEDASARLDFALSSGSTEDIETETKKALDLQTKLGNYPDERLELSSSIKNAYAKYAEESGIIFTDMSIDSFAQFESKEQAEADIDNNGIALIERVFKRDIDVDRLEAVVGENNIQQDFINTLVDAKNDALKKWTDKETVVDEANETVFDPNNASRASVSKVVDLEGAERSAFLEQRKQLLLQGSQEGPPIPQIANMLDLLEEAKTDAAAWGKVMKRVFDDTLNFGTVRNKILSDHLSPENVTDAGIRVVLEFFDSDVNLAMNTMTDHGQIYSLARTMEQAAADPNVDLSQVYMSHYQDYKSIEFDSSVPGGQTVDLASALSTREFARALSGSTIFASSDDAVLSPQSVKTLLTILDARTMNEDPGSRIGVRAIRERLRQSGYHIVTTQLGKGQSQMTLVNSPVIPENVFDDMELFNKAINTPDAPINRLIGGMLLQGPSKTLLNIGIEKANEDPATLPKELQGLAQSEWEDLMKKGIIRFSVNSAFATDTSVPVVMTYVGDVGQSPRVYTLGHTSFKSPVVERDGEMVSVGYFENLPPSYFKAPTPTLPWYERVRRGINSKLQGTKDDLNAIRDEVNRSTVDPLRAGYQREADNINALLGQ